MSTDDRELVRRMLAGEESAFNAFFDSYFPRIYRFALTRLGRDPEAAQEVVQTSLMKAVANLSQYRGDASLLTWVCQICRHQIVDYLRANRRHPRLVSINGNAEARSAFESTQAPAEDEPMKHYGNAETRRAIRALLDRLPGRYGDVLEWKYVEGRSVEEIASLLGIGRIAAQSMLARARASFRDAIEVAFGATEDDVLSHLRGRS